MQGERTFQTGLPSLDAVLAVRYVHKRGRVVEFAVQLRVERGGEQIPVRLYDTSHDELEMHRYDERGKKLPAAKIVSGGDWNAELPRIIREIKSGYERMIGRE